MRLETVIAALMVTFAGAFAYASLDTLRDIDRIMREQPVCAPVHHIRSDLFSQVQP